MKREKGIVSYTAAELRALRAKEGSKTDFARLRAMTDAEIDAAADADPDWRDIPRDWYKDAALVVPNPKRLLSLRLDDDVVDWFKQQGPGYQTRINAALRAFMQAHRANKRA